MAPKSNTARRAAADPHKKMLSNDMWSTPKEDLNPWENSEHTSKVTSKSKATGATGGATSLNNFFSTVFDKNSNTPDWEDRSRGAYSTVSKIQRSKTKQRSRPIKRTSGDGAPIDPLDRFLAKKSANSERQDSDDRSRGAYSTMSKVKRSSNRRSKDRSRSKPTKSYSSDRLDNFLENARGNVKRVDSDERSRGAYSTMSKLKSSSNRTKSKSKSTARSVAPTSESRSRRKSKPGNTNNDTDASKALHGGLGSFLNQSKPKQKVDADERSTYTSMTRIREARLAAGIEEKPIPATKDDLLALIHSMPTTAVKKPNNQHLPNQPMRTALKENSQERRQRSQPMKRPRRDKKPRNSSQRIDGSARLQRTITPATQNSAVKPDLSIYNIRKEEKDRSNGRTKSGEKDQASPRRTPVSPRRRSDEDRAVSPKRRSGERNSRPRSPRRRSDDGEGQSKTREDPCLSPRHRPRNEDFSESGQCTPKTKNTAKISKESLMSSSPRQTRSARGREGNSRLNRSRSKSPSKVRTEVLSPKKRYQAMLGESRENKVEKFQKTRQCRPTEFDDSCSSLNPPRHPPRTRSLARNLIEEGSSKNDNNESCSSLTMPRHPSRKSSLIHPKIEEEPPENVEPEVKYEEEDIFCYYTWSLSRQDQQKIQMERLALKESIRDTPLHRYYLGIVRV